MRRWRADLALLIVTVIWGSTFVIVKNTLEVVSPFVLIYSRFFAAALALGISILATRSQLVDKAVIRDGFLTGLILAGGFITQTFGLQSTEAGKTAFITGLNVVMVPVFSIYLLRKLPSLPAVIGVLFATVGLAFLTLDKNLAIAAGDLWVLACAVFFALHIIITDRVSPRHDVLAYTFVQMLTVTLISFVAAFFLRTDTLLPSFKAVPALLYLGVIATGLVYGLQTWAQRHTTPTRTALIFILEPVFAAIFAVIVTSEHLDRQEWLGGGLILLGMFISELRVALPQQSQIELKT